MSPRIGLRQGSRIAGKSRIACDSYFNALPDNSLLDADVCIVGAGAAGITLALELSRDGHSVLMVESGGEHHERDVQLLGETESTAELIRRSMQEGRARVFGGTTTLWAGQVVRQEESVAGYVRRSVRIAGRLNAGRRGAPSRRGRRI
jgi:glycine/D-amino acid oxidase-like deaminating enzyme